MQYTVTGTDVTAAELADGTWTALEMQRRYRRPPPPATPPANTQTPAATTVLSDQRPRGRPPPPTKKRPLPRLPTEDYKIVFRPQGTVDLNAVGPAKLAMAIYNAAKIDGRLAITADQVRIHPTNNTVTISTPEKERAFLYAKIQTLTIDSNAIRVATYAPAPDDSVRGIIYRAYSHETDSEILAELQARNPDLPVVAARRMGRTRHFVVTIANAKLPRYVRYLGFTFEVYPYKRRPEACFNCRKLGHRADVCPHPRQPTCRRCGAAHDPPPAGQPPTCQASCIVCKGAHPTGSRSCKYRFTSSTRPKSSPSVTDTDTGSNLANPGRQSRSRDRKRGDDNLLRDGSFPPLGSDGSDSPSSRTRSRSTSASPSSRASSQAGRGPKQPNKLDGRLLHKSPLLHQIHR